MTLQRLCKKLEPGSVGDKFVEFYPTFSTVYDKHNFRCPDMHEVDETAVTTVQKPTGIVVKQGMKKVGQ
jgi:hypothetical protein